MSDEGHWCGPDACECGEVHGCVCSNCGATEEDFDQYTPSLADGQNYYVSGRAQLRRQITGERAIDITAYSHEFDRMIEAVRAEEREKYDPAKDERLARYMALVTPLGYASALGVVNALTAMMNVESRASEIAEQARRDEREKAVQIVLDVNAEYRAQEITAQRGFAVEASARIREQGKEQD